MNSDAAQALAELLPSKGSGPVDKHGATFLLSTIAGCRLAAEMQVRSPVRVKDRHRRLLQLDEEDVHERSGHLVDDAGDPVAAVIAWVVTRRVPEAARMPLGIAPDGVSLRQGRVTPLGSALAGCGVIRRQGPVRLPDSPDGGTEVMSTALLYRPGEKPLALVHELVNARWLAAHPPPWPL